MNHHTILKQQARQLRLSHLAQNIDLRLMEATSHQLPHAQFLEHLLQDELNHRQQNAIARSTKAAAFREHRSLSDFDFSFNPHIPRAKVYELATCQYIEQARDLLLIGPPGVGKSHLAQALGKEAIRRGHSVYYRSIFDLVRDLNAPHTPAEETSLLARYLKPQLLIIDDMGMKALPPHSAEHLLEIILRRSELRSTIMTSNRPVDQWGTLLGDLPAASAILDRLLHRAEIIAIQGRSHRLAQRSAETAQNSPAVPAVPAAPAPSMIDATAASGGQGGSPPPPGPRAREGLSIPTQNTPPLPPQTSLAIPLPSL